MANNIDKVRIILVGDSGVGKTCLAHLISNNEALIHPSWTVGCNIEIKLHEYKAGTQIQQQYFIELIDIGGSLNHKNTRSVFYTPSNGIILVHDLTNRKSQDNLRQWLYEILNKEGKDTHKHFNSLNSPSRNDADIFDPEQLIGAINMPVLVIGTKLDLIDEKQLVRTAPKTGNIAEQCGAEEIWLNCRNARAFIAGTNDSVKLSRFFDRVIEKKSHSREVGHSSSHIERRKQTSLSSRFISPETSLLVNPINMDHKTNIMQITSNDFILTAQK